MPVTNVKSKWVDGNLVFYDKSMNIIATWDGTNRKLVFPSGAVLDVSAVTDLTMPAFTMGGNLSTDATTGTKIGTGATQKLGFWNATPVAQQANIVNADGTLADITTKFNTLLAQLKAEGLLASA